MRSSSHRVEADTHIKVQPATLSAKTVEQGSAGCAKRERNGGELGLEDDLIRSKNATGQSLHRREFNS
jgi:hypothetical protein